MLASFFVQDLHRAYGLMLAVEWRAVLISMATLRTSLTCSGSAPGALYLFCSCGIQPAGRNDRSSVWRSLSAFHVAGADT
jgi:hypothetical protein